MVGEVDCCICSSHLGCRGEGVLLLPSVSLGLLGVSCDGFLDLLTSTVTAHVTTGLGHGMEEGRSVICHDEREWAGAGEGKERDGCRVRVTGKMSCHIESRPHSSFRHGISGSREGRPHLLDHFQRLLLLRLGTRAHEVGRVAIQSLVRVFERSTRVSSVTSSHARGSIGAQLCKF